MTAAAEREPVPARDLGLAAWESAPTRAWLSLSQGSFLRGFLLDHGVGNFTLAIIDNLPLVSLLIQPLAALMLGRSRSMRAITMRAMVLERLCCLVPILLVLAFHWTTIPTWALWLLGLSYGAGAVALAGWMTWLAELTEGQPRGAFVAKRSAYDSIIAIVIGLSASALLDWMISIYGSTLGYLAIFLLAGVLGLGTFYFIGTIQTLPTVTASMQSQDWHVLQRPLRHEQFRLYLGYILVLNIGQAASGPFWIVYLLKVLEWSYVEIAIYGTIATVTSLLCFRWWGTWADKVGTIPLLRVITLTRVINPLMWLFLIKANAWPLLIPEAMLSGFLVAGMVPLQLVFAMKSATGDDRSAYMSLFHATQGAASLIGAVIGGTLTAIFADLAVPWGSGFVLRSYHLVFVLAAIARVVSALMLARLREPEALRVHELWPVFRATLRLTPVRPKIH